MVKVSISQHFSFHLIKWAKRDMRHHPISAPPSTTWESTFNEFIHCVQCAQCLLKFNFLITLKREKKGPPRLFHHSFFFTSLRSLHFHDEYNEKDKRLVKRQFHLMLYNSMCHNSPRQNERSESVRRQQREKNFFYLVWKVNASANWLLYELKFRSHFFWLSSPSLFWSEKHFNDD